MAFFLFVDESGHDRRESPYEVLAGVAVEDRDLWNLIEAIKEAETRTFGLRYSREEREIKGKTFLKKKVFRQAAELPAMDSEQRRDLVKQCLHKGDSAPREQITALAQAKCAFVTEVFQLCARYHCSAFARIVDIKAPRPVKRVLRKDYAFLFERFFYFLEDHGPGVQGAVIFDELEKSQSHILIGQMEEYFLRTRKGQQRSRQVIPEPFFVHSDLTTLVQVADLLAYVVAWGFRSKGRLEAPAREELVPFAEQIAGLQYRTKRETMDGRSFPIWSFKVIEDLRGWSDRSEGEQEKRQ